MIYLNRPINNQIPVGVELMLIYPDPKQPKKGLYTIDTIIEINKDACVCKLKSTQEWTMMPSYWKAMRLPPDDFEAYFFEDYL